jgi:integrase
MANLKGGSHEAQRKDIHHRLSAFGEGRHGKEDHLTHSSALSEKREEMSKSFSEFAQEKGLEGKLNEAMTNENIKEFLEQRTEDLSATTALNYTSAFSSMIEGLKESNVDIQADKQTFNDFIKEIKDNAPEREISDGRAIENVQDKIAEIYEDRFSSGVLADIQNETGLRISEAYEVAQNFHEYYNPENGTLEGLVGKGGQEYPDKEISLELVAKIEAIEDLHSKSTYEKDLQDHDISSHDFRYTFAEREFNERIEQGMDYHEALKEVSEEMNHHRESMTLGYLNKA